MDLIEGLSPAISIEQKTTSRNPRSTVGTVTEIHDYMRLLWARVGVPYSPATGLPIESQTVSQMVDKLTALPDGERLYLLAPVVRGRKGEYRKEIAEWQKAGLPAAEDQRRVLPDRGRAGAGQEVQARHRRGRGPAGHQGRARRPATPTASRQALRLADGIAVAEWADKDPTENEPKRLLFSEKFACPVSGFTISEIEPRLFSFNNPYGACPVCDGLGVKLAFDADLVVPDKDKTLHKGAISPWAKGPSPLYTQTLQALARHYDFSMDVPFWKLPDAGQAGDPARLGRREDPLHLRRQRPQVRGQQDLRGRAAEPGAPLARDGLVLGARGARPLPVRDALRGLRRLSPEARGAGGEDRRPAHRRGQPPVDQARRGLVRGPGRPAHRQADGDRAADPEGDQRPPAVPGQRRPGLPRPVARLGHAVAAARASASGWPARSARA